MVRKLAHERRLLVVFDGVSEFTSKHPPDWAPQIVTSRRAPDGSLHRVVHLSPLSLRRSEEHTSELQSQSNLVCRLLHEKKNYIVAGARPRGRRPTALRPQPHPAGGPAPEAPARLSSARLASTPRTSCRSDGRLCPDRRP